MTWIELARKEHPGLADEYIIHCYCPADKAKSMLCFGNSEAECRDCWLRPIPDVGLSDEGPDR